ncbi:hypothetical protein COOONC_23499, partial [Cooperia oncophora]
YCPSSNLEQTDSARKVFLEYHNAVRREVSLGNRMYFLTGRYRRAYLGPAENMYQLTWNCSLEQKAQDQISSCIHGKLTDHAHNFLK